MVYRDEEFRGYLVEYFGVPIEGSRPIEELNERVAQAERNEDRRFRRRLKGAEIRFTESLCPTDRFFLSPFPTKYGVKELYDATCEYFGKKRKELFNQSPMGNNLCLAFGSQQHYHVVVLGITQSQGDISRSAVVTIQERDER